MNNIKISVLCPTRKRSQLMRRVVESCFNTCSEPDQVEVIFGIDDDDMESIEMAKSLREQYPAKNIEYTVWPRKKYVFSDLMNQCSVPAKGEIFSLMSDDAAYETEGWDLKVAEIFDNHPDKIILVQTAGGANPATGFPFMHKNWRTVAGYILAPIFNGDWGDYWLADVVNSLPNPSSRFLFQESIRIKHMHVEFGQMQADETYFEHLKERKTQEALPRSEHPYHGTEGQKMKEIEINKLRSFIQSKQ